jgi:hypothetical protein
VAWSSYLPRAPRSSTGKDHPWRFARMSRASSCGSRCSEYWTSLAVLRQPFLCCGKKAASHSDLTHISEEVLVSCYNKSLHQEVISFEAIDDLLIPCSKLRANGSYAIAVCISACDHLHCARTPPVDINLAGVLAVRFMSILFHLAREPTDANHTSGHDQCRSTMCIRHRICNL